MAMVEPSIIYILLVITLINTQSTNPPLGEEALMMHVRMQMMVLLPVIGEVNSNYS